jgi:hypothetical protein
MEHHAGNEPATRLDPTSLRLSVLLRRIRSIWQLHRIIAFARRIGS